MACGSRRAARDSYSQAQVVLHWATVALVFLQFLVNDDMRHAFRDRLWELDAGTPVGAGFHLVGGLLIFALTLLRLAIRLVRGAPPHPSGSPPLLTLLASLTHWGLYALLLAMSVTGMIAWFGRVEAAAVFHETGRLLLLALVLAHVLGALVEHFVIGNRAIRRML